FKIYGNAGRYYLAMPASVALRAAGASLYTRAYMTYTGIDAHGIPTGLTPIKTSTGGPISANLEYGIPRDPKTATSTNLESEYQDEYILGFDKQLGPAACRSPGCIRPGIRTPGWSRSRFSDRAGCHIPGWPRSDRPCWS